MNHIYFSPLSILQNTTSETSNKYFKCDFWSINTFLSYLVITSVYMQCFHRRHKNYQKCCSVNGFVKWQTKISSYLLNTNLTSLKTYKLLWTLWFLNPRIVKVIALDKVDPLLTILQNSINAGLLPGDWRATNVIHPF